MYRFFSRILFLNILSIIMLWMFFSSLVSCFYNIYNYGIQYYRTENILEIPLLLIFLIVSIWLSTASFLPLIKINNNGIVAYSIFWKKRLTWHEIKTVKLLKAHTRAGGQQASTYFEFTNKPEKKSVFENKGIRVRTFIIVSNKNIKIPEGLLLSFQLFSHNKITKNSEIAFEFDSKAWQIINQKLV